MNSKTKIRPDGLDYFLPAIAPVFIIGMIGSLVYFLITVCYQGSFTERLMWILGLYTVAAVLIARIAIEQGRSLSYVYMLALAAATLVVTPQFFVVSGPMAAFSYPILIALLAIVAVLADRITFDCTSMNEQIQSSGVGVLQSLGLARSARKELESQHRNDPQSSEEDASLVKVKKTVRKHNPGVWVLYLALLALPLFGLGQLTLQSTSDRNWAFLFLFVYLFCSLTLLVLIALLTLRKYLRERGVPMETSFAVRWLAIGMASVFVVLGLLAILPLPSSSLLTAGLPFKITSREDLKASRFGWGAEGVAGENPKAGQPQENDNKNAPPKPQEGVAQAKGGNQQANPAQQGEGQQQNQQGDGKQGDGKQGDGKQGDGKQGDGKQGDGKQGDGKQGDGKQGDGKQGDGKQGDGKQGDGKQGDGKQGDGKQGDGKQGDGKQGDGKQGDGKQGDGKQGDGKQGDGKQGDGKQGDGKQGDGKQGDGKQGDGKQGDGKQGDGKQGDGKQGDGKQGDGKQGDGKQGDGKQGDGKQGDGKQGDGKQGDGKQGDDQQRADKQPGDQLGKDQKEQPNEANRNPEEQRKQPNDAQKPDDRDQKKTEAVKQPQPQPQQPQQSKSFSIEWNIGAAIQWIFMAILFVAMIVLSIIHRQRLLRFLSEIRDWLSQLFGKKRPASPAVTHQPDEQLNVADLYPPFRSFSSPFVSENRLSHEQIVQYLYRSLLSWGYERRIVRRDDETPEEYVGRLSRRYSEQSDELVLLGKLYNRIAYARGKITSSELEPLSGLWSWLSSTSKGS